MEIEAVVAVLLVPLVANGITMFTNSKPEHPFWRFVQDVLNAVAFNIGKNKNADSVDHN